MEVLLRIEDVTNAYPATTAAAVVTSHWNYNVTSTPPPHGKNSNYLYDTNNKLTTKHASWVTMVVLSFFIGLFMIISSAGSSITMLVIWRHKALHTKANCFIFSLCLSDLISALLCSPLWLYRRTWGFRMWQWGAPLCKVYWVGDYTTNYVTSLHIVSFAALRFAAVHRPFLVSAISKRHTLAYILSLWIVSVCTASPLAVFMDVDFDRGDDSAGSHWPSCSIGVSEGCCLRQYDIYIYIVNPIFFYLPVILITCCSLAIAKTIQSKRRYRERHLSSKRLRHTRSNTDVSVTSQPDLRDVTISRPPSVEHPCPLPLSRDQFATDSLHGSSHTNGHASAAFSPRVLRHNGHAPVGQTMSRESSHSHKEVSTFTQLTLIVISFMIGYIPVTVYLLWSTATPDDLKRPETDYWFGTLSYVLLRLSECLNPVVYNIGSKSLRSATMGMLGKLYRC